MRGRGLMVVSACVLAASWVYLARGEAQGARHGGPRAEQPLYRTGEILVKVDPSAPAEERDRDRAAVDGKVKKHLRRGWEVWSLGRGVSVEQALDRLKGHGRLLNAEPNYCVSLAATPGDSMFGQQWGLHNTGQSIAGGSGGTPDADIGAVEAWDITTGSESEIVAVIDDGVEWGHPELQDNMWHNPLEYGGLDNVDDDQNGIVDDIYGANFTCDDELIPCVPGEPAGGGHGTAVAAIIGARANNGHSMVGVAWNVKLMALKIASDHGGSPCAAVADVIEAIDYAVAEGAKVMNASLSFGAYCQALYDSVAAANTSGVLLVASVGNAGVDLDAYGQTWKAYPAQLDLPNVVSVTATDRWDGQLYNYGRDSVDLGAPGEVILTLTHPYNDATLYLGGTSFAAPHVTGVAALMRSAHPSPSLSPTCIRTILLASVDPVSSLNARTVSGGRLNAYRALQMTQTDGDSDGVPDVCDNCPTVANPTQAFIGDPVVQVASPNGGGTIYYGNGNETAINWSATDACGGVSSVDILLSRNGVNGSYSSLFTNIPNSGSRTWTATGPATSGFTAFFKVVARDPAGNTSSDTSDAGSKIMICACPYCGCE